MLKPAIFLSLLVSGLFLQGPQPLIDNERVTVWDTTWAKGKPVTQKTKYDQVTVELADAPVRIATPGGKPKSSTVKLGQATFIPKGTEQTEESTGDALRRAIVIDLKDVVVPPLENKSGYPDAFPRDGIKKLLDNKRVTVWDYTWVPGKPTPIHFHTKDVVTIYLATGEIRSKTIQNEITVNSVILGLTRFNRRDRTHNEELIKGDGRAIIVELK